MTSKKTNNYLEVQVRTASKEQLLIMLYDGALRFCELARQKIEAKDIEGSHKNLVRAKAIVVELMCSLDKRVGDDLYYNLIRLYNFIYLRLVEANFNKSLQAIDESIEILTSLRETWTQAMLKNSEDGNKQTYSVDTNQASSFSIQG